MVIRIVYNFIKGLVSSFPSAYINNNCISVRVCTRIIAYILDLEPVFYLQCNSDGYLWSRCFTVV